MFDLPTTLSKFLNLGMSLPEVIACATINAARAVRLEHAGTLAIGTPADIALFRIEEGDYRFYDVRMHERSGDKLLVNTLTLVGGHLLPQREERARHFWAVVPEIQRGVRAPGAGAPDDLEPGSEPENLLDELYNVADEDMP